MCNKRKTHIVGLILNVCMRHMRKSMQFQPGLYKDKWKLTERLQKSALKFPLQFISRMTRTTFKNEF